MTTPESNAFPFHCQAAPIAKAISGAYVLYVEDHQEESRFFKPNVMYLPRTMNCFLKPLLHNNELFNLHGQILKETMLEVMQIGKSQRTLAG
jgi:hypothetical protein